MKLYAVDRSGCWEWLGGKYAIGYGQYKRGYAHRIFYELYNGELLANHHIHHTCHNKGCVNPGHLIQVTKKEHNKLHHQIERASCKHEHPVTKDNTYVTKTGHWKCRACNNIRQKGYTKTANAPRHNRRLNIINGVREDFGRMPIMKIALKYNIGWRSVYRYADKHYIPTRLGYFK